MWHTRSQLAARIRALAVVAGLAWLGSALAQAPVPELRTQLRDLATAHDFVVKGLPVVGEAPGKWVDGDPRKQIAELLRDFNYVVVEDGVGSIERVLISSVKRPAAVVPRSNDVDMIRRGDHHVVEVLLTGPTGVTRTESLMLDTGASAVVLPESMRKSLGFTDGSLRDGWSQTANGKVRTRHGLLRSVRVGRATVEDVAVNFIDDESLGSTALLGMSFLGRFRVTIDDANQRLILFSK